MTDLELMLELMDEVLDHAWSCEEVETDDLWQVSYQQADTKLTDLRNALLDEATEVAENETKWGWFMDLVRDLKYVQGKLDEVVNHLTDDMEKVKEAKEVFCVDHEHRIAYDNLRRSADSAG